MSATKFLYVNTVSDKVVRHSLAYLFVQKWLVEDSLSTWRNGPTTFKNSDFQSVFFRSASAV